MVTFEDPDGKLAPIDSGLLPPSDKKRAALEVLGDTTVNKKAKGATTALVLECLPKGIWVEKIFPFLGPGHFVFVAGVCRELKELYLAYYAALNKDRKFPHPTFTYYSVAVSSLSCAKYLIAGGGKRGKICRVAAKVGQLDVLKWAREQEFPWDRRTCAYAARHGHVEILQWMQDQNLPFSWGDDNCWEAARNGHLHVLKWLRSQDPPCPWDEGICRRAASLGRLDMLQWARKQHNGHPPCPWDEDTCSFAAIYGHLDILQWAR